jgi:uncharacterized protein (DUF3820 family)
MLLLSVNRSDGINAVFTLMHHCVDANLKHRWCGQNKSILEETGPMRLRQVIGAAKMRGVSVESRSIRMNRRTVQQPMMNAEHLRLLVSREMPYGKYKGRLIADLPGHYLGWFAREGFPKGELGSLIALMYELDHNALRHLLDPLRKR